MGRSFFRMGFSADPFMGQVPGMVVGPLTLKANRKEIEAGGYKLLRDLRLPQGFTGAFPYVVKIGDNSGEYLVYADGTASFTDYGSGRVGAPIRIKQ
jgi:hypothetical protein